MLTRRRATSRGFTLTEVLVTLGVISLVLALALPALSTVRHSGRRTESLSNLRQMAMAAHQYMVYFEAWPTAVRNKSGMKQAKNRQKLPPTPWRGRDCRTR